MDVIKELPTVGALDEGDPEDADDYQEDYEQPVGRAQGAVSTMHRSMDKMKCAWESGREGKWVVPGPEKVYGLESQVLNGRDYIVKTPGNGTSEFKKP